MTTGGSGGEQQQPVVSTVSILQLWDMIREEAELTKEEMEDLPLVTNVIVSREVRWEVGKPVPGVRKPGESELLVFALFHGPEAHDVTVYALPRDPRTVSDRAWVRYIINRVSPALTTETMNRKTFMSAAANDLFLLAFPDDGDDDEEVEPEENPEGGPPSPAVSP